MLGMTERMCIVTREVKPIGELVRFVLAPDHTVVPDIKCDLPGRGVWVSASHEAVARAVAKNAFGRGFKAAARAGTDLADLVGTLLSRRALGLLSLAQKAGLVRTGFTKVQNLIETRRAVLVIHAADAAGDGVRKITGKISSVFGSDAAIAAVRVFISEELSLALGRPHVIHAALTDAKLTAEFALSAGKYETYWQGESCARAV